MKSRLITFLLFVCTASLWASGAVPDSLLAEHTIRAIYVNHPDSALSLLDEAEKRQAPGIKPFRIDLLRAMCYEIKHDYLQKEQCVRRALQHDSICSMPEHKLPLLVMLANILDRQNKYEECVAVCHETIDLARRQANRQAEADMYSVMARVSIGMANNEKAEAYFKQAVELLESTEDVRQMSRLSSLYGEYMSFYIDRKRVAEAIRIGYRREALIRRMSELPGPPPGYIDQQYGFLYAKMAVLLHEEGKNAEAEEAFKKLRATSFSQSLIGKQYSIPYLLDTHRHAEVAALSDECLSAFPNDTVSYEYLILLNYRARAERGMKRFDQADALMQRIVTVTDSIYARESQSKAQEYASKFDLKEKELQLTKSRALSERRKLLLTGFCLLSVLLFAILWTTYMNLRKNRQRNRIAAKQIDELLAQRDELRRRFAHAEVTASESLAEDASEVCRHEPGATPAVGEEESVTNRKRAEKMPEREDEEEYARFMKMESVLVEQKLFLESGFGRDNLLAIASVSKNELGTLLRKYANADNLNDYLNSLRIEYSIKLMKEKPFLSIDAIAAESNFNSRSTFYRAFVKVCGMTPAQYMRTKIE